jgi:urease accessory protein
MQETLVIESVFGDRADPAVARRLHEAMHHGALETLLVEPQDLPRRRFHSRTDRGTPCFVSLPRSETLFDGAVLHLSDARAVVVCVGTQRWLRLVPVDAVAALELGYLAGNLHWRIRFDEATLGVAIEGPLDGYLARIRPLVDAGRVRVDD